MFFFKLDPVEVYLILLASLLAPPFALLTYVVGVFFCQSVPPPPEVRVTLLPSLLLARFPLLRFAPFRFAFVFGRYTTIPCSGYRGVVCGLFYV